MPLPNSLHYPTRTKLLKSLHVNRGIDILNGRVEIAGGEEKAKHNHDDKQFDCDINYEKRRTSKKKFYENSNLPFIYKKNDVQSLIQIQ